MPERDIIFSARVSIDGVGEMHNEVRQVKRGFDKALETIRAMQELQKRVPLQLRHLDDASSTRTSTTPRTSWRGRRPKKLDIVFNMVRFTEPMLGNADLADTCKPIGAEEERMRQFFLDRVRMDPLLDGQNYIYMHYADMIAQRLPPPRALPVPDAGHHAQSRTATCSSARTATSSAT